MLCLIRLAMMDWTIEEGLPLSAEANMHLDEENLLSVTPSSRPRLRFYSWERPAATYGYFFTPSEYFDLEAVSKWGLDLARRPTGGGSLFHVGDLAFSIVLPATHFFYDLNPLSSYRKINDLVLRAIQQVKPFLGELSLLERLSRGLPTFCMAKPTIYDILIDGKKVGGAAERKTRFGLLHQGSLFLHPPDPLLIKAVLHRGEEWLHAMEAVSQPLAFNVKDIGRFRSDLKGALVEAFLSA